MNNSTIKKEVKRHGLVAEFIDNGIAFRVDNTVLIHKDLYRYPEFCQKTLEHEFKHTSRFTGKDFMLDMFDGSLFDTIYFCIKHPKAFSRFSPISFYKGSVLIEANLIIFYLIIGVLLFLILR